MLLVVIFVVELYPVSMASLRSSGQQEQAKALAETVMADWLQQPFSAWTVGPLPGIAPVTGMGTTFQATAEILAVNQPGVDPTQIKAIRVQVSWMDRSNSRQLVRQQWRTNVNR
jgi:hypothetical protein